MLDDTIVAVDDTTPRPDLAILATAGPTSGDRRSRPRLPWRRILGALVAVGLLFVGYQPLVGQLMHANRQRHLSAEFGTPAPRIRSGGAVGILQIPSVGVNDVIVNGAGTDQLRGGPGLMPGTALPGTAGTSVIVGHRDAYGGPFAGLDRVAAGAAIAVQTRNLRPVQYVVTSVGVATTNRIDAVPEPGGSAAPSRLILVTDRDGEDGWVVVTATAVVSGPSSAIAGSRPLAPTSSSLDSRWLLMAGLALVVGLLGVVVTRHRRVVVVCLLPVWIAGWVFAVLALEPMLAPLR